ncbi:MAG: 50S ribosomal protein L25 [bacterium]|nr:50S ribosomal protein L25 [bacterium]
MEKTTLTAKIRTVIGKKVKNLRKEGLVPANLFGKNVKSLALEIPVKEFLTVYKKVGESGLVELKTEKETFHTLITKFQTHPVTRLPVHAEFHAVSLTEKIKAHVPVELTGESLAVKDGIGLILQTLNEIEVEALPMDLPEKIEVGIDNLIEINAQLLVSDLPKIKGVEIVTHGDEIVVKIVTAVSEEAKKEEEKKVAEEAAKAAETPAAVQNSDQALAPAPDSK